MKNAEFKFGVTDGSELLKLNPQLKQKGLINFTDEMKKILPGIKKIVAFFLRKYNNRLGIYYYQKY